jgi:hypothetical protein
MEDQAFNRLWSFGSLLGSLRFSSVSLDFSLGSLGFHGFLSSSITSDHGRSGLRSSSPSVLVSLQLSLSLGQKKEEDKRKDRLGEGEKEEKNWVSLSLSSHSLSLLFGQKEEERREMKEKEGSVRRHRRKGRCIA